MRSDRVVVLSPLLDDDLSFFQTVEDLSVEQFVPELCSDMPASRQATGVGFPCAIDISIWRSSVTICSALNLFFGMTQAPFQAHSLTTLGSKSPGRSKYRVHDLAIVNPSALSTFRQQRFEKRPFLIAQIKSHDPPPRTVNHVRPNYSIIYLGTDPSKTRAFGFEGNPPNR